MDGGKTFFPPFLSFLLHPLSGVLRVAPNFNLLSLSRSLALSPLGEGLGCGEWGGGCHLRLGALDLYVEVIGVLLPSYSSP